MAEGTKEVTLEPGYLIVARVKAEKVGFEVTVKR